VTTVGLSQQRSTLGEGGDIEGSWEPIDDRAQRLKRFVTVACFDAEPGKVACGIQFEEAGSLLVRLSDGALIAEPGLFVMTLCLPQAAAQPSDFRDVILLLGSFDQVFGLTQVIAGLFELIGAELIFGELRQIARQKKQAVSLTPLRNPALKVCQTSFLLSQFK
jgi:hypothetical protein